MSTAAKHATPLADDYRAAAKAYDEAVEAYSCDPCPENDEAKDEADAARDEAYEAWLESDEIREWAFRGESLAGGSETGHWHTPEDVEAGLTTWTKGGDWELTDGTIWVTDRAIALDPHYGEEIEDTAVSVTVTFRPLAPACTESKHAWTRPHSVVGGIESNPGVYGKGGGTVTRAVCRHCGIYRVTDTWAQNPSTGEQGLTSVAYEDADDDSIAWIEDQREQTAQDDA